MNVSCLSLKQSAGLVAVTVMAAWAGLGWLWPLAVYADTTITVTVVTDELQQDGDCSLREAVQTVNSGLQFDNCGPGAPNSALPPGPYLISLNTGDYTLSRAGAAEDGNSTGDLDLIASVTIQGVNAALTRINGGAIDRVLDLDPTAVATMTVTLANLTIENGLAPAGSDGGGIRNTGALSLTHVTITNNTADFNGDDSGDGGGIRSQISSVMLKAVIMAGNVDNSPPAGSRLPDGAGAFSSAGYNLIGDVTGMTGLSDGVNNDRVGLNPLFGPLTGAPAYYPLQPASPAIDQVPAAACTFISSGDNPLYSHAAPLTFARNGMFRASNDKCDIGAFEGPAEVFVPLLLK